MRVRLLRPKVGVVPRYARYCAYRKKHEGRRASREKGRQQELAPLRHRLAMIPGPYSADDSIVGGDRVHLIWYRMPVIPRVERPPSSYLCGEPVAASTSPPDAPRLSGATTITMLR